MEKLGPSIIVKDFRIGVASDFWHLYESDIALAADLGAPGATGRSQLPHSKCSLAQLMHIRQTEQLCGP